MSLDSRLAWHRAQRLSAGARLSTLSLQLSAVTVTVAFTCFQSEQRLLEHLTGLSRRLDELYVRSADWRIAPSSFSVQNTILLKKNFFIAGDQQNGVAGEGVCEVSLATRV